MVSASCRTDWDSETNIREAAPFNMRSLFKVTICSCLQESKKSLRVIVSHYLGFLLFSETYQPVTVTSFPWTVCYYLRCLELLLNKIQFSCLTGARKSNHMQRASVGKTGSTQERRDSTQPLVNTGNLSSLAIFVTVWLLVAIAYIKII